MPPRSERPEALPRPPPTALGTLDGFASVPVTWRARSRLGDDANAIHLRTVCRACGVLVLWRGRGDRQHGE